MMTVYMALLWVVPRVRFISPLGVSHCDAALERYFQPSRSWICYINSALGHVGSSHRTILVSTWTGPVELFRTVSLLRIVLI